MADYEELKRLADAATPGPWGWDGSYICPARTEDGTTYIESWRAVADAHDMENVRFIAAANPATVLALIAEVEQLRAERASMASALMRIVDLSNSGHGPIRAYRQMFDIAAEARRVLGLEVENG